MYIYVYIYMYIIYISYKSFTAVQPPLWLSTSPRTHATHW